MKKIVACGLDIGSLVAKGVFLGKTGLLAQGLLATGANAPNAADILFSQLLKDGGISPELVSFILATGYGRVSVPFASKTVTEISCHARGIAHFLPETRTLVDLGGQDSKAIRLNGRGKVLDFAMNDKCAAGTGRFLEVMARGLGFSLPEMSEAAARSQKEVAISATCTVFAESEVIGLIARGEMREDIARGVFISVAQRVVGLVHRVGLEEPVAMSGGVARNPAMVKALEKELGRRILLPSEPQMIGAWGAALIALDQAEKSEGSAQV